RAWTGGSARPGLRSDRPTPGRASATPGIGGLDGLGRSGGRSASGERRVERAARREDRRNGCEPGGRGRRPSRLGRLPRDAKPAPATRDRARRAQARPRAQDLVPACKRPRAARCRSRDALRPARVAVARLRVRDTAPRVPLCVRTSGVRARLVAALVPRDRRAPGGRLVRLPLRRGRVALPGRPRSGMATVVRRSGRPRALTPGVAPRRGARVPLPPRVGELQVPDREPRPGTRGRARDPRRRRGRGSSSRHGLARGARDCAAAWTRRAVLIAGQATGRVEIRRPLEDVFEFVANFENEVRWKPGVVLEMTRETEANGLGARYAEVLRAGAGTTTSHFTVT